MPSPTLTFGMRSLIASISGSATGSEDRAFQANLTASDPDGDALTYSIVSGPGRGTVVASEPYDDDPHWQEVPDRTLLAASRTDVLLTPLKEPSEALAPEPSKESST